ncbi:class I adenylate-forming enzyme family protein [Mycobacterium sp. LTG2003]
MTDPTNLATLPALVRRAADRWPDRRALVFDPSGHELTFAELAAAVADRAAALRQYHRVARADRIAVMLPNDADFPVTWLALAALGAITVPVNTRLGAADLAAVLTDSRARLIVTNPQFHSAASEAAPAVPVVTFDELAGGTCDGQAPEVYPEDPANLQFTSGSTGKSKGCLVSHGYWAGIARIMTEFGPRLGQDDVLLTAQPFYYMDPMWNLATTLLTGAPLVVTDGFHPSTFWATVRRHQVTYFYCLGVMPAMLLTTPVDPDERDHRLRYISCSAIPQGRHDILEQRFGARWYELYGSTETGIDMMVEEADHDRCKDSGALGTLMPNRDARVVDPDTAMPVARGERGILQLRGTWMSDGYPDSPAANDEAYRGGWYRTGDIVSVDANGYFIFHGRAKDIIQRSGENIAASQVEAVLQAHDEVGVAACLAATDRIRGEEIVAFVVPRESGGDTEDLLRSLMSHAARDLASFKVPRYWVVRESLPLTPSAKVSKPALRQEVLGQVYDRVDCRWSTAVTLA